jgi:hypothetical protein
MVGGKHDAGVAKMPKTRRVTIRRQTPGTSDALTRAYEQGYAEGQKDLKDETDQAIQIAVTLAVRDERGRQLKVITGLEKEIERLSDTKAHVYEKSWEQVSGTNVYKEDDAPGREDAAYVTRRGVRVVPPAEPNARTTGEVLERSRRPVDE